MAYRFRPPSLKLRATLLRIPVPLWWPATHSVTDAKGGRSGGVVIPNFVGPLSLRFAPSRTQTLFHNARVQTNTPHQNKKYAQWHIFYFGRSGGVRTRDLLPPRQTRYQAALHPE